MNPHQRKSHPSAPRAEPQDEFVFFYYPNEPYGELCQWYKSRFSVSRGEIAALIDQACDPEAAEQRITFNCAEQFMMYCKAGRFQRHSTPSAHHGHVVA
jgi:NADAR domain